MVHPTDSVPFIQASSLAGVLRQYYAQQHDEKQAEKLFGMRRFESNENSMEGASKVRFSDGIFHNENLILELRPRVKINPERGLVTRAAKKVQTCRQGINLIWNILASVQCLISLFICMMNVIKRIWRKYCRQSIKGTCNLAGRRATVVVLWNCKGLKKKDF